MFVRLMARDLTKNLRCSFAGWPHALAGMGLFGAERLNRRQVVAIPWRRGLPPSVGEKLDLTAQ